MNPNEAGKKIAIVIGWWLAVIILGSITGIWIKFFWIGWVLK